ncbi:protein containing TonB [mine drainage metagenome]|uniref:Protein containing TonB n=1 Tax=mine drainage metagenome TaxID=410659 RepID=T1AP20_9ZZZZ
MVHMVPAKYPLRAARRGEQGWVDVEFTVNPDGSVSNVHVTDSKPRYVFDRAATGAVSRWRFKSALINGRPAAVVLKRQIEFKLSGNG